MAKRLKVGTAAARAGSWTKGTPTRPGATVAKRQVIGRVMDAHGRLVEEIRAPAPSFIAAIVRDNRAIHSGTMVAECCAIEA